MCQNIKSVDLYRDNEVFEDLRKTLQSTAGPKEEQRQALLYELNSSGKYFAFKEQLKHATIKIVREKYLQTTNFASQQQLQVKYILELSVSISHKPQCCRYAC